MKMTLQLRIVLMVGFLMCCILFLLWFSYKQINAVFYQLEDVSQVQLPASKNMTNADMMHDGIRGVVMNAFVAHYENNFSRLEELKKEVIEKVDSFNGYIQELEKLKIKENTALAVKETLPALKNYGDISQLVLSQLVDKKFELAQKSLVIFDNSFEELEVKLEKLGALIDADANKAHESGEKITFLLMLSSILSILIGGIFSLYNIKIIQKILNSLTLDLGTLVQSVSLASKNIEGVSTSVAQSSQQQAAALTQSSSSLHEIGALAKKTDENARMSLVKVQEVTDMTQKGGVVLDQLEKAMHLLEESNKSIQGITTIIEQIEKKTEVINEIVFKTQLLSFNASIEAARAGSSGRGFAVVAEEVGALALLSGESAHNIEALLSTSKDQIQSALQLIRSRIEEGNQISSEVRKTFLGITNAIELIRTQVEGTTHSIQSQNSGIQETSRAVVELEDISKKSQEAAMNAQTVSRELLEENKKLENVTKLLKNLVHGTHKAA